MRFPLSSFDTELEVKFIAVNPDLPTIIFLHDSLGCIALWRDFPELLAQKSECNYLVYDRIGYGKSTTNLDLPYRDNNYHEIEADILISLIKDLKIRTPILFGHSDGGTIALIAAAKEPVLIKGIITEGAHVFVEELTLNGIREAENSFKNTNLRDKLYKYHGERVDEVVSAWINIWLDDRFRNWNIENFLSKIICPSLIIQGENDEFGTLYQVESIINQVAGTAEKLILPNLGHTPHKENQSLIIEQTAEFIKKIYL